MHTHPLVSHSRVAPLGILAGAFGISIAIVLAVTLFALRQPYLGVQFSAGPDGTHVFMESPGGMREKVTGIVSEKGSMDLLPLDFTVEPDGAMGTYATYHRFLRRQDMLARLQRGGPFTVLTEPGRPVGVTPSLEGRPLSTLPHEFWIQVSVGMVSFLVSAVVFAFRSGSASARYLLLSGFATLIFAPAAALYTTREFALPGMVFRWANDLNFFGGSLFAASFAALLLHYPKKLAPWWVGGSVVFLFVAWFAAQHVGLFESMTFARRFLVLVAVVSTFALAGVHWFGTRKDPVARASLNWFLLSWIVGSGLFAVCILLPQLFGVDTSRYQGYSFLLFLLVYAGLAFGILRYRLFELGEWRRSVLIWSAVIFLLVALYLTFVVTLRLAPGAALAFALLFWVICGLLFRNWLWGTFISPRDPRQEKLFSSVLGVALAPVTEREERWKNFLTRLFEPLDLRPATSDPQEVAISGDGASMVIPAVGSSGAILIEYPARGTRLFSRADFSLASESRNMLDHAIESRCAYESGVAEERSRIAMDIHDNISSQLLSALQLPDVERKDSRIRETMAEIREMIRGSSDGSLTLEESLSELRFETAERLFSAGIGLEWTCHGVPACAVSPKLAHALRSVIREAVSNVIKHSKCSRAEVSLTLCEKKLLLFIVDDGKGFDSAQIFGGSGLSNLRTRLHPFGAETVIMPTPLGTTIKIVIPLEQP